MALEPLGALAAHAVSRRLLHPHKGLADPRGISTENISQVRLGAIYGAVRWLQWCQGHSRRECM